MADQDAFDPLPADQLDDGPLATGRPAVPADARADGPLGRAPAFDFAARRFVPGLAGGPLQTTGRATLAGLVEKCVRTRRGEHPAVDPGFGVDLLATDLLEQGGPHDASALAEYVAALEDGVRRLPRVSGVEDVRVVGGPDDDAVLVSLRVRVDGDEPDLDLDDLDLGTP